MKTMSFPEARACLVAAGFRYLGTACIADWDTSHWAHPTPPTLATIRGWGDDYTPHRAPATYDALVRVVLRILGERQDFVPDETLDSWFHPVLTNREIRRDLRRYVTSVPPRRTLLDWAARQARFDRPVLVVWATEDRIMPREHGRRLGE